jgi:hypothetical protein
MKTDTKKNFPFAKSGKYRIRVLGLLDERMAERLGNMRIRQCEPKDQEKQVTELVGKVRDQAELSGLLNSLYELHLTLLSVKYLGDG